MEFEKSTCPEWMKDFLQIRTYEDKIKCKIHVDAYRTVFCSVCMGEPICGTCWKSKDKHQGHLTFQVYQSSGRTGIEIERLNEHWDASEVQTYKSNGKNVFYLNSLANPKEHVACQRNPLNCETCDRKLIEEENRFCSIACKIYSMECSLYLVKEKSIEEVKRLEDVEKRIEQKEKKFVAVVKRWVQSRKRKGFPRRSPLF